MTGQASDRRRFTGRRGLEGEIVDRSDVGGSGDASSMHSTIRYCKGHGWQVLAGVNLSVAVARACDYCEVIDR